ncbi:MAG: type II secretion system F family protein [Planctomycetota bacterium]|jgi:type IV pilus assembly protein PilC
MMAVYEYTARDADGNKLSGIYNDVDSVAALRKELAKMGDTLLKARRKKIETGKRVKIKQAEVVAFAYKFAGMCSAGLPISRCLETVEEQTENQAFKYVLSDIRESIEAGTTLKEAFEKYKYVFSDFFVGMLEAGESGGRLSETLEMSANYMEKQADLKSKVKSAFAYPIVVGVMCIVIVTALVIFIIPVFSKLYQQLHIPLPGPTKALVGLSVLVRSWWWLVLLIIVGAVFLFRRFSKNPYLKAKWDVYKLNMPVFARLNRMVVVSRFMRTFAMLASAGISFIKALDVASAVANNSRISEITGQLQQSIEAGDSVGGSLRDYDIFPPIITQMVSSGEEAGALPEMLNKGVDFLDKDIDRTIKALLVKLEPAMTLIMGIIVGFILMGVYLPMFDYMSRIK